MSEQFNATVNLTTEGCITCGIVFTIPCILRKQLLKNHDTFYCPNGHPQIFSGETEEQKKIKELEEAINELVDETDELEEENRKAKNKINYLKRQVKK